MTTGTTMAALMLYFQREATGRKLETIDETLRSPATPRHASEAAAGAKVKTLETWALQTRRFDLAYETLCQTGLAPEFWAALARHRPATAPR